VARAAAAPRLVRLPGVQHGRAPRPVGRRRLRLARQAARPPVRRLPPCAAQSTRRAILCARTSLRRRTPSRAGPRLARFRELFGRAGLPAGFIHGDGFLDNILCADDGALAALVDWEDSCVAPYVLDVAVAVSAAAFTASNELLPARCAALLGGYAAKRPLSDAELGALPDFMWAGALACGFYRWREFNIHRPESADDAKGAYKIMQERCERLEAAPPDARAWVGGGGK